MSNSGKLNLIWFRDEEPAKRLRVRPGWLRAVTYGLMFMVLFAAGGMFAAYEFWRRSQDMQSEKREVDKRLSETLLKLERLQNIEKLLHTSDPTELSQMLGGLGVETPASKTALQSRGGKDSKDQGKSSQIEREKTAGLDLADIMGKVDLGQVGVENFRTKLDSKGVQYAFDLSNLMPQPLAGNGQLLAVTKDGGMTAIQTGKEDLGFNIQRFKQVSAQAQLPQGVDPGHLFGLRLVLTNASGKTIFSETYPLAQAQ